MTLIDSVISTTSQASIISNVSISLQAAFKYSLAKGPFMVWHKFGLSALISAALAFKLIGETG